MKFSIGDKVLLKRTGEEGSVVAFLSKTMMEVEVAGTHFPVYNDEVDHPYLKWFTDKKARPVTRRPAEIQVEKPAARAQRLAKGIYLSFLAQFEPAAMEDIVQSFRIHLINETPDNIEFNYLVRNAAGESLFQHKGNLHAFGHLYLHPFSLEVMNSQPRFHWAFAVSGQKAANSVTGLLRIRPAQLVRHIQAMLERNNPGFDILLTQDAEQTASDIPSFHKPAAMSAGIKDTPAQVGQQVTIHTLAESVVDLHMEKKTVDGAVAADLLLQLQLSLLDQKLQAALVAGMQEMIVIHGIGKGVLRNRVHQLLADMPGVRSYSNHWMGAYGWGATVVYF